MALLRAKKNKIIKNFSLNESDTGSPEVQVAIFTERITQLTKHLKKHKKDNHSRRGLFQLVGKRRRMLSYLQKIDKKRHKKLTKALKLK